MEIIGLSLGRAGEIEEASKSSSPVHTETSCHQTLSARGHRSPTQKVEVKGICRGQEVMAESVRRPRHRRRRCLFRGWPPGLPSLGGSETQ